MTHATLAAPSFTYFKAFGVEVCIERLQHNRKPMFQHIKEAPGEHSFLFFGHYVATVSL